MIVHHLSVHFQIGGIAPLQQERLVAERFYGELAHLLKLG
jgi:hypothetical protein